MRTIQMENGKVLQIASDDEYLASLNIPYIKCDLEEQLEKHLMCSFLCCPKQIDNDGAVTAQLVNTNMRELTLGYVDLYIAGRISTDNNEEEIEKIQKNLEHVFQLPICKGLIELDERAKFRPLPPECIELLYKRILAGGKYVRTREGQSLAKKEKECNTPKAVYRAKVACNFLLELIEREQRAQKRRFVDWQSVQKRYQEMCLNADSEDKDLLERYQTMYKMDFSHSSLNNELIKAWSGRSTITKALSMPLFCKIQYQKEAATGTLKVGFGENITLYPDEELKRAAELMAEELKPKGKFGRRDGRRREEEENKVDELVGVIPLRQRLPQSNITSILPDTIASPFAKTASQQDLERRLTEYEDLAETMQPDRNIEEPQYVPTSTNFDELSDSDSSSESDDTMVSGIYSDEEELSGIKKKQDSTENSLRKSTERIDQPALLETKPLTPSMAKVSPQPARKFNRVARDDRYEESVVKPFANPWEVNDEGMASGVRTSINRKDSTGSDQGLTMVAPPPEIVKTSTPKVSPQPQPPLQPPRHVSAFASCKPTARVERVDSQNETPFTTTTSASENERQGSSGGLYERRSSQREREPTEAIEKQRGYDRHSSTGGSSSNSGRSYVEHQRIDEQPFTSLDRQPNSFGNENKNSRRQLSPLNTMSPSLGVPMRKSAFSREVSEDYVRRTPRNDFARPEPARSSTALGNMGYGESYDRNDRNNGGGFDSRYDQRSSRENRNGFGESRYEQKPVQAWRQEPNERFRSTSSASMKFGHGARMEPEYPANQESNRGWPKNDGYYGEQQEFNERSRYPSSRNDDRYRNSRQNDSDERNSYSGQNRVQRPPSEVFRGNTNATMDNRYQPSERSSESYNRSNRMRSSSRMEYSEPASSHRDYHNDANYGPSQLHFIDEHSPHPPPLTDDQKARLRIIRDYTYLHRDANNSGLRTLDGVLSILPSDKSVDWVELITTYLPQVELVPLETRTKKELVLIWKGKPNGQIEDRAIRRLPCK
ncbi:unnamed protein product [Cylicocyclus nassatus]|uniref:Uncharacterized protein n=1 Tax=Cylicocyclus nassatus TaxID=53992 RepID=A0AA36GMD1_CYLNA|nr:unnamed protein product [Cylicocyclus nassatus]